MKKKAESRGDETRILPRNLPQEVQAKIARALLKLKQRADHKRAFGGISFVTSKKVGSS